MLSDDEKSEDGEDGDEEEEGEEEPEIAADENAGRPRGKFKNYEIYKGEKDYDEKGTYMDHEGTKIYATGPKTLVGVIVISDLYGWSEGRMKEIVDYLGYCVHGRVMMPRMLDDPCCGEGTAYDGLPEGFDQVEGKQELKSWLMKYTWENWRVKIQACLVKMRKDGVKRICGVGFGFGAWVLSVATKMIGEYLGSILIYPEVARFDAFMGNEWIDHLAKNMKGSVLFMPHGAKLKKPFGDQGTYHPGGELFELLLKRENEANNRVECMPFDEMRPGWVLSGDLGQVGVRPSTLRCVQMTATRLKKILWPPPPGADSSTLRTAARDDDIAKVEELISFGVELTGEEGGDMVGLQAMHYAAREGNPGPIKVLLAAEADPNETGGVAAESALHIAAYEGVGKCCKVLIDWKCDIEIIDKAGQTPMHYAAANGQAGTIKMLLQSNARIDPVDTSGQSPLHLGAYRGHKQVVMMLLSMRADVDPFDLRMQTPQKRAKQCQYQAIFDVFETERENRGEAPPEFMP